MLKKCTLACLALLAIWQCAFAQTNCPPGTSVVRLELQPDPPYFDEVSWQVKNVETGEILYTGECTSASYVVNYYCVPDSTCIEFMMLDDAGDGLWPSGFYRLYYNNVLVHANPNGNYGQSETTTFACPEGSNCTSAAVIGLGDHTTLDGGLDTWFRFTPTENGTYSVSTCDSLNTCPTKIWVYGDDCTFIVPVEGNAGTLFYSADGCGNDSTNALATLFLAEGISYHIRVGYAGDETCNGAPIHFSLDFGGPIVGCTDSLACNYNPLASISSDCIYPGDPDCPEAPDLVVLEDVVKSSFILSSINNTDPCFIEEGCLRGFGMRNLVRFDTHIKNIGEADYFIGLTPSSPTTPSSQFVWDPCHNHWHYLGYAEYLLFDADGNYVPVGSKTGFCVLDLECDDGGDGKYTCQNMGITAGCGDIYERSLDCQWIDITGLAAGQYTFVMRVNWDQSPDKLGRVEKDFTNNWAQACFQLSYSSNGAPDVDLIEPCAPYVDCEGTPYGNVSKDCEGVCGGPALHGDLNLNLDQEFDDVDMYLAAALLDTAAVSTCRDLFDDNHTDVYDAALLQECILYSDSVTYWGTRFPCQYPTGKVQTNDLVNFRLGSVDTLAHTIDIRIQNSTNKILGYEIQLGGIKIDSIKNLAAEYDAEFAHTDNRIVALSRTEKPMNKHNIPTAVLRVHYSTIPASIEVCIDSVIAVVNERYNKSVGTINAPVCAAVTVSSIFEVPKAGAFIVSVVPNPAFETASVLFENERGLPTDLTLTDLQGRVVRQYKSVRESQIMLSRQELSNGVYLVHLRNELGSAVAKLIWQ
jgi:hypothetical protein